MRGGRLEVEGNKVRAVGVVAAGMAGHRPRLAARKNARRGLYTPGASPQPCRHNAEMRVKALRGKCRHRICIDREACMRENSLCGVGSWQVEKARAQTQCG